MTFDFDASGNFISEPGGGSGFDFDADGNFLAEKPQDKAVGGFGASVKQSVGSAIKGAGQAASDFVPGVGQDNALKRYGQGLINANPTAIHSLEDIAAKPGTAVAEAVGSAGGSVAQMLGARAVGTGITALAPLTGPAAPITALIGQAVSWFGPAAIAALPSYGGIRDKQILNDPGNNDDWKAKAVASLGAAAVGAIEAKFGPQEWALSAMTKGGRVALAEKFAATTIGGSVLKAAAKGAAIEGGEELAQSPIEQLASYDDPTTKENLKDTAFSGAMGAIGGGVIGGGFGVAGRTKPKADAADILAAPDVDSAIQAAQLALPAPGALSADEIVLADSRGNAGTAQQFDALRRPRDIVETGVIGAGRNSDVTDVVANEPAQPAPATQADPAALLERQMLPGDPMQGMLRERQARADAADRLQAEAEQQKLSELDAIPQIAQEQNTVQAAVSRAGALEAPTAMQLALQRAKAPPESTAVKSGDEDGTRQAGDARLSERTHSPNAAALPHSSVDGGRESRGLPETGEGRVQGDAVPAATGAEARAARVDPRLVPVSKRAAAATMDGGVGVEISDALKTTTQADIAKMAVASPGKAYALLEARHRLEQAQATLSRAKPEQQAEFDAIATKALTNFNDTLKAEGVDTREGAAVKSGDEQSAAEVANADRQRAADLVGGALPPGDGRAVYPGGPEAGVRPVGAAAFAVPQRSEVSNEAAPDQTTQAKPPSSAGEANRDDKGAASGRRDSVRDDSVPEKPRRDADPNTAPERTQVTSAIKGRASDQPAAQAEAILDAAGIKGAERLTAIKDIRSGAITVDELARAHPAKEAAARETDAGVAMFKRGDTAAKKEDAQRAQAAQGPIAREILDEIAQRLTPLGMRPQVAETVVDLPASAQKRMQSEGIHGVRGMYDPATDKVWLVRENISSADEGVFVGLHEAFHRGFARTFGSEAKSILHYIDRNNAGVREKATEYMGSLKIDRAEAIEEVLADLAGAGVASDLKGWDKLVKFLKGIVAKIANGLGVDIELTDQQVIQIVTGARKAGVAEQHFETAPGRGTNEAMASRKAAGLAMQSTDPQGFPEFVGEGGLYIGFAQPTERLEFIPGSDAEQMFNMVIMRGERMIGSVDLLFDNGRLRSFYDIVLEPQLRGQGAGASVLQTLLAANPGVKLEVSNIVEQARSFWESVGISQQNRGAGEAYDGTLDWQTFVESRAGRRAAAARADAGRGSRAGRAGNATGDGPDQGAAAQVGGQGLARLNQEGARGTTTGMATRKDVVGKSQGGRSADDNTPGAGREYPLAEPGTRYQETKLKPTMMTPDEFLAKARPLEIDESSRENIDELKSFMLAGRGLDPLHLYANGKEDGRHRAHAARELGITQVPVIVHSTNGSPAPNSDGADDVMFSRSVMTGKALPKTWQGPDASKLDDLIYSMQDKHVDTKRVLQSVRAAIGTIADQQDPYLQEELFHGRAAMATKEFLEKSIRPLLAEMQARQVDVSDFEEFLHNRHAERRNVQVAKINPNMQDGGSGIKTADARAYLSGLPAGKKRAYEALAKRVDQINKDTRTLLVSSGLEKQETIDAWQAAYGDEYVPLMREEMDNGMGTGQGYSVRGSSSKRALGSDKPVADILANIALQREKAITRSEKRRIGEALYGLVLKAPNDDFWFAVDPALQKDPAQVAATAFQLISMGLSPADADSIAREPTQSYLDPTTKQVAQRINPALRSADNVLAVRIDGEDKYVFFNAKDERAMRMATALKNLDADQLGTVMGSVAKMTRYFSAINTQYNPIFGITNITRDVQTALLNLNSTPLKGHKAAVMKHILPALRGIYIDLRDHRAGKQPTSSYAQIFEEFQREGGATGFRDMYANAKERADAIADELKAIDDGKAMQLGKGIMAWLSDYNESMENAVRVAAYKVGKEQGLSKQQAASLAKNLTVNFNRKGQVALQAGALYAFFNASVQGTARISQTMFEGGKLSSVGKKIITGGLLLGGMQALLLAAAGFDDDEPPDFVRERSLVIPIGDKKYFSIPMPLGFHVIPNLGRIPAEWAMGGFKNTPKRIGQLIGLFADAFNPIGSAGLSLQTLTPTIIDPLAALSENRDFTGKPIAKKDFNALSPTAGHTRAKDTATPWARMISYGVNLATGGTDYKPGLASPTPDQIDYLIGQVTGGVGREVGKVAQVASGTMSGEDVPLYKIPLVGRFVGTTEGQSAEASRFYNNLREIGTHKAELDGLRKDRKGAEARAYLQENREALLVPMADRLQREVSKLNSAKRELMGKGASPEQVKLIDARMTSIMKVLNDRVRSLQQKEAA